MAAAEKNDKNDEYCVVYMPGSTNQLGPSPCGVVTGRCTFVMNRTMAISKIWIAPPQTPSATQFK